MWRKGMHKLSLIHVSIAQRVFLHPAFGRSSMFGIYALS